MDSYSVLFPPVKHHVQPTSSTTMHKPETDYRPAAAAIKPFKPPQPPLFVPPGHVVFRLLCHASRIGGVIGKSGSIIKQLQQLTNCKIRVEDPPDCADHRVISVLSSPAFSNRIKLSVLAPKHGEEINGGTINGDGHVDEWFDVSAAQEGTLRVFERVVEVAAEGDSAAAYCGVVSCQLLVSKYHGGAVIGKGGKVVEKIKMDTGCKIKVFSSEIKFSPSWGAIYEIIEIEGHILSVKKALILVTSRLQEFLPLGITSTNTTRPLKTDSSPFLNGDGPIAQPMPSSSINHALSHELTSREPDKVPNVGSRTPQQKVVFKMLCPNEKVGGIIGTGGFIVVDIKNKTGASISIGPIVAECDERLITITAMESVESQYPSAQNAAILVFSRSVELDLDSKGTFVLARLLVPSNQVGCFLGKGGSIISEMRKATGTGLRFIWGNQVPKCASENSEVLQITGEFANVQNALLIVTRRLRDNMFSMIIPTGRVNYNSLRTEDNVNGRVRDISLGISYNLNEDKSLTQSMDRLRIFNNIDQPASPSLLPSSQTVCGVNQGIIMDNGGRFPSAKGGVQIGSGSRSAIVTNTTIELVVPDTIIGSIYGENGSNVTRLRQISGAKVMVHEPRPGTNLRIVVISGTPVQTQAAQSLLQAFIMGGS
ncbi:hypothetical protein OROHE_018980 [Orobanche hederae]